MKMLTIPVKGFWVLCNADSDLNEEFGAAQFAMADNYLNEQRELWPQKEINLIAEIDA